MKKKTKLDGPTYKQRSHNKRLNSTGENTAHVKLTQSIQVSSLRSPGRRHFHVNLVELKHLKIPQT